MLLSWRVRCFCLLGLAVCSTVPDRYAAAGEPPKAVQNVVVYREEGRFAGWPANHGIWAWGDEILVGFSRGYYKDLGRRHNIDRERPEEHLLARSRDGGETWKVEVPQPPGALSDSRGWRHGTMPPGVEEEKPVKLTERIKFTHPDLALTVRMGNSDNGVSRFHYSYDRGHSWKGPYLLPLFGQKGVMARTDYIIDGPNECTLFLTASKANGREGRPFCTRTTDGGLTWDFLSFIGPEPKGYAIMPSTVRLSQSDLVTTIRVREPGEGKSWIEAFASHDDGRSWSFLNRPAPDTGEGNPPSLVRVPDGRLGMAYGYRGTPSGMRVVLSGDQGKSWTKPVYLRDDGGGNDVGYPRSIVRPDGKVVTVYYYHDRSGPTRYLAATIWDPGTP